MQAQQGLFSNRSAQKVLIVYCVFVGLYIISALLSPSFRTLMNMNHLLSQVTPLVIAGVAQSLILLLGGFDLSIGSIIALTNVATATMPYQGSPLGVVLVIAVPLAIGLAAGAVNGALVGYWKLPSIIVTLATSSIFLGIALFWMPVPGGLFDIATAMRMTGSIGIIPTSLVIFLGITGAIWFFLRYARLGRYIYIVGGNQEVAALVGVNAPRVTMKTFAISGLVASCAGIFLAARMYSGDPAIGAPYVLDSIAVAVIGGTSLAGGEGGVIGTIAGAFILSLLNNILNMLGISTFYQYIMKGVILILAVAITSAQGLFALRLRRSPSIPASDEADST